MGLPTSGAKHKSNIITLRNAAVWLRGVVNTPPHPSTGQNLCHLGQVKNVRCFQNFLWSMLLLLYQLYLLVWPLIPFPMEHLFYGPVHLKVFYLSNSMFEILYALKFLASYMKLADKRILATEEELENLVSLGYFISGKT